MNIFIPAIIGGGRLLKMGVLETILIVLEAICSVALIGVVLMQSGKEAGLSGALSGSSDSYLSKNKKGNLDAMLASSTKWIALAWVLLTLSLSLV
jgi:preprotein translocase subunit SecG